MPNFLFGGRHLILCYLFIPFSKTSNAVREIRIYFVWFRGHGIAADGCQILIYDTNESEHSRDLQSLSLSLSEDNPGLRVNRCCVLDGVRFVLVFSAA